MQCSTVKNGYSPIEIMLGLVLIGLMLAGAYFLFNALLHTTKVNKTETNLQLLKTKIDLYNAKQDQYPKKLSDLVPRHIQKLPKDGWNNDFYYKLTPGRKPPYQLYSYGPNGPEEGTAEERITVEL